MSKIQYRYTNMAKQVFILVCFLYTLLRFIIMMEIIIFKIDKYYEVTNIPMTLIMYALLFAIIIMLFRGHKFCYSHYNEEELVYYNTLLHKKKSLDLSKVNLAVFGTFGVKFFEDDKPVFFLPFFRGGIISAVQIDQFYKMLKNDSAVKVVKKFTVLPGYSNKWKLATIAYALLAIAVFMNFATPITVIVVLFQSH